MKPVIKSEEEQNAAMDQIDELIYEYLEKYKSGTPPEEIAHLLQEVFLLFREYCPFEDIVERMDEVEEAFANHIKNKPILH